MDQLHKDGEFLNNGHVDNRFNHYFVELLISHLCRKNVDGYNKLHKYSLE